MQVFELERRTNSFGEMISKYEAGKRSVQIIGTFEDKVTIDDLLYSIACRKIMERLGQKRDNIVLAGGNGIIKAGK